MTSTRGASSQTPTKRWWRRRGEIDAVPADSNVFEFAHLLDPLRPNVAIAITGDVDVDVDVELDPPGASDEPCSSRGHDVVDLLAEEEPWIRDELAWADDGPPEVPAGSDEPWPFEDDAPIDLLPNIAPVLDSPLSNDGDPTFADEVDALLAGPARAPSIVESAAAESESQSESEPEPDPELEPVSAVLADVPAVSRFANAGVDDDRLPIVRSRRAKRSRHRTTAP